MILRFFVALVLFVLVKSFFPTFTGGWFAASAYFTFDHMWKKQVENQ